MEILIEIFKDVFVLKIVDMSATDSVLYLGVSSKFKEVETGETIPLYGIEVTEIVTDTDEDGLPITFKHQAHFKIDEEDETDLWTFM